MTRGKKVLAALGALGLCVGTAGPAVARPAGPADIAAGSSGAPRCHVSALKAHASRVGAAAGNEGVTIRLRNATARSCSLNGYAGLLRLNRHRQRVQTRVRRGSSMLYRDPGPARVVLKSGEVASFGVGWTVGSPHGGTCASSRYLEVTPPNAYGHRVVRTGRISPCGGGSLYVTAVQSGKRPDGP